MWTALQSNIGTSLEEEVCTLHCSTIALTGSSSCCLLLMLHPPHNSLWSLVSSVYLNPILFGSAKGPAHNEKGIYLVVQIRNHCTGREALLNNWNEKKSLCQDFWFKTYVLLLLIHHHGSKETGLAVWLCPKVQNTTLVLQNLEFPENPRFYLRYV